MDFNTNYDRTKVEHSKPETNDGPVLVELDGYMTMEQQIAALIDEGRELAYARAHQFDWAPGVPVDETVASDPTRARGFDIADASMLARNIRPQPEKTAAEEREADNAVAASPGKGGKDHDADAPRANDRGKAGSA